MSSLRQHLVDVIAQLQALTWPSGAAELVFGAAVYASHEQAREALAKSSRPFAIVTIGRSERDEECPTLFRGTLYVDIYVWNPQGWVGESGVLGANRTGGVGSSKGRGLAEIEEVLLAIGRSSEDDRVRPGRLFRAAEPVAEIPDTHGGVTRRYELEVWATAADTYPDAVFLHGVDLGGGQVRLNFERPGSRSDYSALILRRASGSTPPASATDGTGVTITSESSGTHVDAPGAGTWAYALFGRYGSLYSSSRTWTGAVT